MRTLIAFAITSTLCSACATSGKAFVRPSTTSHIAISSSLLGASSARARMAKDDIATFTINWPEGGDEWKRITLTFSGSVIFGAQPFTVELLDRNGVSIVEPRRCVPNPAGYGYCTVTFQLEIDPQSQGPHGGAMKIRVDSTKFGNRKTEPDSLTISANPARTNGIAAMLAAMTFPLELASVVYK